MTVTNIREYYVYNRETGGEYLTSRSNRRDVKYRWAKDKSKVIHMSYDAAQKARLRYGGELVRVDTVITERPL